MTEKSCSACQIETLIRLPQMNSKGTLVGREAGIFPFQLRVGAPDLGGSGPGTEGVGARAGLGGEVLPGPGPQDGPIPMPSSGFHPCVLLCHIGH